MDSQSDLEVILDFLEEYYKHSSSGEDSRMEDDVCWTTNWPVEDIGDVQWTDCDRTSIRSTYQQEPPQDTVAFGLNATTLCASGPEEDAEQTRQSPEFNTRASGSGRKVRLFHFLFEMLEDPCMAHCVSWVPAASGVFRFSSRNKDEVAALWGQRKGNRRPMTYQKMSRALRNYARSGEILKVKKKLTYRFSWDTLQLLRGPRD